MGWGNFKPLLIPPFILKRPLKVFSFPRITYYLIRTHNVEMAHQRYVTTFFIKLLTYGTKVQNHAKDTYNEAKTCQTTLKRRY
jgi:hypothetical protein